MPPSRNASTLTKAQRHHKSHAVDPSGTSEPRCLEVAPAVTDCCVRQLLASLAATTLLWQGTALDRVWALNPTAYKQLAPLGGIVGIFFLVLGMALVTAGIGWFRRRLWGWRLAVGIVSTQVLGNAINCLRRDWLRGTTGVMIAGALLLLLLRPRIRAVFA